MSNKNLYFDGTVPKRVKHINLALFTETDAKAVKCNTVTVWKAETVLDAVTAPRVYTSSPGVWEHGDSAHTAGFEASAGSVMTFTAHVKGASSVGTRTHNMAAHCCFKLVKIVGGAETVIVDHWSYEGYIGVATNGPEKTYQKLFTHTFSGAGTYKLYVRASAFRENTYESVEGYADAWTSAITIS